MGNESESESRCERVGWDEEGSNEKVRRKAGWKCEPSETTGSKSKLRVVILIDTNALGALTLQLACILRNFAQPVSRALIPSVGHRKRLKVVSHHCLVRIT